ncbi:hypothetical protein EDD15DRAFT_2190871 [Pisolithus albus]|nr:hypothetical protein EDD15DRAFT_2190871 [Pisolithus albus]
MDSYRMVGSEQLMESCQDGICLSGLGRFPRLHSMPTGTAVIRKANEATAAELAASVPALYQADGRRHAVQHLREDGGRPFRGRTRPDMETVRGEHVHPVRNALTTRSLFAVVLTSKASYVNSSFGWAPRSKKREMFDARSRFIIAFQEDTPTRNPPNIVAYTMFRFDREEHQDVVYWYALSDFIDRLLASYLLHCGLGKLLTRKLSDIGATWGMEKVMLTVFKGSNRSAFSFYRSVG